MPSFLLERAAAAGASTHGRARCMSKSIYQRVRACRQRPSRQERSSRRETGGAGARRRSAVAGNRRPQALRRGAKRSPGYRHVRAPVSDSPLLHTYGAGAGRITNLTHRKRGTSESGPEGVVKNDANCELSSDPWHYLEPLPPKTRRNRLSEPRWSTGRRCASAPVRYAGSQIGPFLTTPYPPKPRERFGCRCERRASGWGRQPSGPRALGSEPAAWAMWRRMRRQPEPSARDPSGTAGRPSARPYIASWKVREITSSCCSRVRLWKFTA